MKTSTAKELLACASGVDISNVADDGRVLLLPMGSFDGRGHGRSYRLRDLAHAEAVVTATKARAGRTDIMVDYDHQSVFGAKDGVGGKAPASGWIKPETLQAGPDGISAVIDWTAAASEARKAREYRYLSPYFGHRPDAAGDVTRIINVALTNTPAIEELPAVAATANPADEGSSMKKIAKALGLDENADEDAICTSIAALNTAFDQSKASLTAAATALGLKEGATSEELTAAATAAGKAQPDPKAFVPMAMFAEVKDKLDGLVKDTAEDRAAASVQAAMEAGKVTPVQKDWALTLAKSDPKAFDEYLATATAVITPGQKTPKPAATADTLNDEDRATCSALNISEEDFLAQRKLEAV